MQDAVRILLIVILGGVVACEGTIEFAEDSEWQGVPEVQPPGEASKADTITPTNTDPQGGDQGAALFQQFCGACHGADATGGTAFSTSIRGYEPIEPVVKEGKGTMAPVPIDDESITAIQEFLLNPATPQDGESPEETVDGSSGALEIYEAECAACHGAEGEGNEIGPPIRHRDEDLIEFTVRNGRNGPGVPSAMPTYSREDLPDEKLTEIMEWLASFPNPQDGEGLYVRYCTNCHGENGLGGPSFEPVAGLARVETDVRNGHSGPFEDRREYMSAWTEEELSAEEVDLIEEYLRSM